MKDAQRQQARARLADLIALVKLMAADGARNGLVEEAEALDRAIGAFHMEAIRFRMFDVDRRLQQLPGGAPEAARRAFEDVRAALEAAGFHTRSH